MNYVFWVVVFILIVLIGICVYLWSGSKSGGAFKNENATKEIVKIDHIDKITNDVNIFEAIISKISFTKYVNDTFDELKQIKNTSDYDYDTIKTKYQYLMGDMSSTQDAILTDIDEYKDFRAKHFICMDFLMGMVNHCFLKFYEQYQYSCYKIFLQAWMTLKNNMISMNVFITHTQKIPVDDGTGTLVDTKIEDIVFDDGGTKYKPFAIDKTLYTEYFKSVSYNESTYKDNFIIPNKYNTVVNIIDPSGLNDKTCIWLNLFDELLNNKYTNIITFINDDTYKGKLLEIIKMYDQKYQIIMNIDRSVLVSKDQKVDFTNPKDKFTINENKLIYTLPITMEEIDKLLLTPTSYYELVYGKIDNKTADEIMMKDNFIIIPYSIKFNTLHIKKTIDYTIYKFDPKYDKDQQLKYIELLYKCNFIPVNKNYFDESIKNINTNKKFTLEEDYTISNMYSYKFTTFENLMDVIYGIYKKPFEFVEQFKFVYEIFHTLITNDYLFKDMTFYKTIIQLMYKSIQETKDYTKDIYDEIKRFMVTYDVYDSIKSIFDEYLKTVKKTLNVDVDINKWSKTQKLLSSNYKLHMQDMIDLDLVNDHGQVADYFKSINLLIYKKVTKPDALYVCENKKIEEILNTKHKLMTSMIVEKYKVGLNKEIIGVFHGLDTEIKKISNTKLFINRVDIVFLFSSVEYIHKLIYKNILLNFDTHKINIELLGKEEYIFTHVLQNPYEGLINCDDILFETAKLLIDGKKIIDITIYAKKNINLTDIIKLFHELYSQLIGLCLNLNSVKTNIRHENIYKSLIKYLSDIENVTYVPNLKYHNIDSSNINILVKQPIKDTCLIIKKIIEDKFNKHEFESYNTIKNVHIDAFIKNFIHDTEYNTILTAYNLDKSCANKEKLLEYQVDHLLEQLKKSKKLNTKMSIIDSALNEINISKLDVETDIDDIKIKDLQFKLTAVKQKLDILNMDNDIRLWNIDDIGKYYSLFITLINNNNIKDELKSYYSDDYFKDVYKNYILNKDELIPYTNILKDMISKITENSDKTFLIDYIKFIFKDVIKQDVLDNISANPLTIEDIVNSEIYTDNDFINNVKTNIHARLDNKDIVPKIPNTDHFIIFWMKPTDHLIKIIKYIDKWIIIKHHIQTYTENSKQILDNLNNLTISYKNNINILTELEKHYNNIKYLKKDITTINYKSIFDDTYNKHGALIVQNLSISDFSLKTTFISQWNNVSSAYEQENKLYLDAILADVTQINIINESFAMPQINDEYKDIINYCRDLIYNIRNNKILDKLYTYIKNVCIQEDNDTYNVLNNEINKLMEKSNHKDKLQQYSNKLEQFKKSIDEKYKKLLDISKFELTFYLVPGFESNTLIDGYHILYLDIFIKEYYDKSIKNMKIDVEEEIVKYQTEDALEKAKILAAEANDIQPVIIQEISTDCMIVQEDSKAIDFKEINYTTDDKYTVSKEIFEALGDQSISNMFITWDSGVFKEDFIEFTKENDIDITRTVYVIEITDPGKGEKSVLDAQLHLDIAKELQKTTVESLKIPQKQSDIDIVNKNKNKIKNKRKAIVYRILPNGTKTPIVWV